MPSHDIQLFPPTDNCLAFLDSAVKEMFHLMDHYIDKWTKQGYWSDRPYNSNERATLSILAGAIWRSNPDNFVIEEMCGDKNSGNCTYRGRHDIWFLVEGKNCYGEAKQVWPDMMNMPGLQHVVNTLRTEAEAAALSKFADVDFALGIVFAVPDISGRQIEIAEVSAQEYQRHLGDRLGDLARKESFHVLWGKYLREDLLRKEAFYRSTDKGDLSRPGVDVVIATKPK